MENSTDKLCKSGKDDNLVISNKEPLVRKLSKFIAKSFDISPKGQCQRGLGHCGHATLSYVANFSDKKHLILRPAKAEKM